MLILAASLTRVLDGAVPFWRAASEGLFCSPLHGWPDPSPMEPGPSMEGEFLLWWVGAGGEGGAGEFALSPFFISPGVCCLGLV